MTAARKPSGGRASTDVIIDIRDRFSGPARHQVVGEDPRPTILDDLRDLWADIAASPTSHAVVGFVGVLGGLAVTLGPALVWSWFL